MKLSILGAGAWGTALALSQAERHQVTLWTRDGRHAQEMEAERCNNRYFRGFPFPPSLRLTSDIQAAAGGADLLLAAVPTAGLRQTLKALAVREVPLIWVCKGFEGGSAKMPHQVVAEEWPTDIPRGVLSGPSFAQEVAAGLPTALTLASGDEDFACRMAQQLHTGRLRIYNSDDVIGVEVGGAVKNVMAIAAGISDGLGFGYNARAALITRGLAEITRLGLALGGRLETFMGLTGMGDLILTCTGNLSRNRTVGLELAKGRPLAEALEALGHIAEGVHTAKEVLNLARELAVEMPITEAVYRVLYQNLPAALAVDELLGREPKTENFL